jgi:glycosyltransferase involved in cell wall biosynthesis
MPSVSIIICTRNRAESLRPTLESIGRTEIPNAWDVELLVVDNGSIDDTSLAVAQAVASRMSIRRVEESRMGLSHARNRGLAEAVGDVILFTDDDVRVPADWITEMSRPIAEGSADAVAGAVHLAPHLDRSWLRGELRGWVGATGGTVDVNVPGRVVGANMAFGRHILKSIPAFDVELGAGALGFYEEALFWRQIIAAGATIVGRKNSSVEHHFSADRLNTAGFALIAGNLGRSLAYLHHHWEHGNVKLPRLRSIFANGNESIRAFRPSSASDVPEPKNLFRTFHREFLKQFVIERARPRNYERHGLVKLRGALASGISDAQTPKTDFVSA